MNQIIFAQISLLFITKFTYANCRGCCSRHKGVTCNNGRTACADGSTLSAKCQAKGCNKCEDSIVEGKKYSRKMFRHWVDADGDCQNTRAEILIKHNIGKLQFKTEKRCMVIGGKWIDPYSGKIFTKARDLDVDHIVTLKHAYEMGANSWTTDKRKRFANDFSNLLPVWSRLNRQKGAKGPSKWIPPLNEYKCSYIKRWNQIKNKYQLKQPRRDIASVESLAEFCK